MKDLDEAHGFTRSGNAQIERSWLKLAIRNDYQPSFARLEEYLMSIGRRMLIEPLYKDLMKTPAGTEFAKRVYAKARPGYHPNTVAAVDAIVKPRGDAGMISEWMKVMLEEIARKKAEAEEVRAEERRRSGERAQGLPRAEERRRSDDTAQG